MNIDILIGLVKTAQALFGEREWTLQVNNKSTGNVEISVSDENFNVLVSENSAEAAAVSLLRLTEAAAKSLYKSREEQELTIKKPHDN